MVLDLLNKQDNNKMKQQQKEEHSQIDMRCIRNTQATPLTNRWGETRWVRWTNEEGARRTQNATTRIAKTGTKKLNYIKNTDRTACTNRTDDERCAATRSATTDVTLIFCWFRSCFYGYHFFIRLIWNGEQSVADISAAVDGLALLCQYQLCAAFCGHFRSIGSSRILCARCIR